MFTMASFQDFEDVFEFDPDVSYDQKMVGTIEKNRKDLEGLFIDKVLKLVLKLNRPAKVYPPKSNADLRALHQSIVSGNAADHHQLSVLYYILLDCGELSHSGSDLSDSLEEKYHLPKKYQIMMQGLWHMDNLRFEEALRYLTYPSLIPTFPEEILDVLVRHSSNDDMILPLAYYHTVQPKLTTGRAIDELFSAITKTSVTEAFYFSRGQAESSQRHLFELLLQTVLQHAADERMASQGVELINLPFTPEEEVWFEEYLTTGEGKHLRRARDTLLMRKIGTGRYSEVLSVDGSNSRMLNGLNWDVMKNGIKDGLGPRHDLMGA